MRLQDSIDIVEVGYQLADTDAAWLGNTLEALRPSLDAGLGVIGFFFDRNRDDRCVWGARSLGADPSLAQAMASIYATMPSPMRTRFLGGALAVSTSSEILTGGLPLDESGPAFIRELVGTLEIRDACGVMTSDASGLGCIFGSPLPVVRRVDQTMRRRWSRLTAHLASGLRLQRALAETPERPPEAVLDPNGRLREATGPACELPARERLRSAVLAIERARGPLRRRDGGEALALWPALVEGRWSLVDRFEASGRRYMVAHRNDVPLTDPRALSPRERAVAYLVAMGRANKRIAYELGIAEGTVGSLVARIARKLGTRSRAELVRFINECATAEVTIAAVNDTDSELAIATARAAGGLDFAQLTPREQSVARAATEGLSNEAIADRLQIAPRTVANVMSRVFRRLGIGSRGELAHRLIE